MVLKADITRNTFRKEKNYRRVIKQQGRVDIDADSNEFQDIEIHHERTSLRDVIGKSGAPLENPGFAIIPSASYYKIGMGRYYVDGILVENYDNVDASNQPDLPNPPLENHHSSVVYPDGTPDGADGVRVYSFPEEPGIYLAYLHVWERHITALDDNYIQESALGEPDTATRSKVVWQVQLLRLEDIVSITIAVAISEEEGGTLGTGEIADDRGQRHISFTPSLLQVKDPDAKGSIEIKLEVTVNGETRLSRNIGVLETEPDSGVFNAPLSVEPNTTTEQVRIRIKDIEGEKDLGEFPFGTIIAATYNIGSADALSRSNCTTACKKLDALNPPLGSLRARAEPEIGDTMCMIPPRAKYTGLENLLYRVEIHNEGMPSTDAGVSKSSVPKFKWSPVNGTVVTKITKIDSDAGILTVSDIGKDRNLGFAPQQWVEVTDDSHELWRLPGTFVKLDDVDHKNNELRFDPHGKILGDPINDENFHLNPRVRRWDYKEGQEALREVKIATDDDTYIELDSGVQIQFVGPATTFMTGNYWLIPARTLKRDVEWPSDENGPEALLPEGIQHHFSCLAVLKYSNVIYSFNWKEIQIDNSIPNQDFKHFLSEKLKFRWAYSKSVKIEKSESNPRQIIITAGQNSLFLTVIDQPNSLPIALLQFPETDQLNTSAPPQDPNAHRRAQLSSRFVRIDNEQFSDQTLNTGEELTVTGELTSLVNRPLRASLSVFSESANAGNRWELLARDPPGNIFDIAPGATIPYSITVRALEPGTYHVHTQLNIEHVGPGFGRGQTVVVFGPSPLRLVYEFGVELDRDNSILNIRSSPVELISDCRKFFPPAIDRTQWQLRLPLA